MIVKQKYRVNSNLCKDRSSEAQTQYKQCNKCRGLNVCKSKIGEEKDLLHKEKKVGKGENNKYQSNWTEITEKKKKKKCQFVGQR